MAEQLRDELLHSRLPDLDRRRAIAALSVANGAVMAAISLFQLGMLRRLPEPPLKGFDAATVNTSRQSY